MGWSRTRTVARLVTVIVALAAPAWGREPAGDGEAPPEKGAPADDQEPLVTNIITPGRHEREWRRLGPAAGAPVPRAGVEPRGFGSRAIGVRGIVQRTTTLDSESSAGAMAYERAIGILMAQAVTARYFDEMWIGTDGIDLSYALAVSGAVGLFLPIRDYHGPFARLELRANLRQEAGWSIAQLRVPGAQVGWTFSRGVTQWELLIHGSAALLGHVDTGLFRRPLEGLAYGGALTMAWQDLRLDADLSLIAPETGLAAVLEVRAHACGLLGKKRERPGKSTRGSGVPVYVGPAANDFRASMCADVSLLSAEGSVMGSGPSAATQTFVGLSILVGRFTRLDPPPKL